jgi:hypothetical protein
MNRRGAKMKDVKGPFLSTFFPRLFAALCVVLLIGGISLACIAGVALIGPALGHGENPQHAAGKIVEIGPGKDFMLETESGQQLFFQCSTGCRATLAHMQRHLNEHAHTDVYYIEGQGKTLMALDVD